MLGAIRWLLRACYHGTQYGVSIVQQVVRWFAFASSYEIRYIRKEIFPIISSCTSFKIVGVATPNLVCPNIHTAYIGIGIYA